MASLDDNFELASFAKGVTIFPQGDPPDYGYLIQSGTVEIIATRDGVDEVLDTLTRGDFFGEMALVDDEPRSAAARAIDDVSCTRFSKSHVEESLAKSDLLTYALIRLLTKRLRRATASRS